MNQTLLTIFIGMNFVLSLGIITLSDSWTTAYAKNTTSPNTNDTRMVFNVNDNTITLVNTTSNETISTKILTENAENTTTIQNLTEKFEELKNE